PARKENTKVILMLIFTFTALSILSIFAINPTIVTIIELHKTLDDNQFVYQQLLTKKNNLSNLQQQYSSLSEELSFLYSAIPETANVPYAIRQIESIAQQNNVTIISLSVSPVIISDPNQPVGVKTHSSFSFSIQAVGSYQDMLAFAETITDFDRMVTIESLSFVRDDQQDRLILGISGREYFKQL
ncbi:MAG TPA: type 4a pilus biogenesis protein PilO, partial [Patescibacteria group bacterium]|nr:type 4a pilus biogenesis protein PilO [Patescibacteria group bacterium]